MSSRRMMKFYSIYVLVPILFSLTNPISAQKKESTISVNQKTDSGSILLPNQLKLQPAGEQINLGDFPTLLKLSPDGKNAVVLHTGYGDHEIRIIDINKNIEIIRHPVPKAGWGMVFEPEGTHLWISGGVDDILYRYGHENGRLTNPEIIDLGGNKDKSPLLFPGGLAISPEGKTLYITLQRANKILSLDIESNSIKTLAEFPGQYDYPYSIVRNPLRHELYISLWGASRIAIINLKENIEPRYIKVGQHPTEMRLTHNGKYLFVSNSNENTVSVIDLELLKIIETLSSSLHPNSLPGSTPGGLAISPDEKLLAIANADNNNIALFNIEKPGHSHALGHIPVGWYPTSISFTQDGKKILVTNGKGNSSFANPEGPNPMVSKSRTQYIGGLMQGTLSIIRNPDEKELREYTTTAYQCNPYRSDILPVQSPKTRNPIPGKLGDSSPIKYCVYIIKENRTYDQVFGDLSQGNGDPELCIFGREISPNHHAIVENWVLFDNFYVESEVSADGHEWSTGAYATDYVEKIWPLTYGGKGAGLGYPGEGTTPMGRGFSGHIWDRAAEAKITYRSYGEFAGPKGTNEPNLKGHYHPDYTGFDMNYSDLDRAKIFINELNEFNKKGDLPGLIILRLPNDHTSGTKKGALTPRAFMAENDLALGMIVESLTHSKFWKEMAVFVVEDDAQNGSDHVDAHRTVAMVISPYVKRKFVDHTLYSTASLLHTMELILGLQPMTQFDAGARPLFNCFTMKGDFQSYTCLSATWNIKEKNPDGAYGQARCEELNLAKEDAIPDVEFNEIIWKSIRGADSIMPPPVRAGFILAEDN